MIRETAGTGDFHWRLRILGLLSLCLLSLLVARLWMLQLTQWTEFVRQAAGNRTSVTYLPAPRGLILDRHGVVLADNRPVWTIAIVPDKFPRRAPEAEKVLARLAGILRVPTAVLRPQIEAAVKQAGREAVPLEEVGADISFAAVAQIEEQGLPGVIVLESAQRVYPCRRLAAHVLGYARAITEEQYNQCKGMEYPEFSPRQEAETLSLLRDPIYGPDSLYGQAGVEARYEINQATAPPLPILAGRRGRIVYEVDAALRPVRLLEYRLPASGATLRLCLDAVAQRAAEAGLEAALAGHPSRTGAAVAMDVENGGILVLASAPAFDPNDWVGRMPLKLWQRLNADPRRPLLNKATMGGYAPASTFKIISLTAALELGKATPHTRYYCGGAVREGARRFKCWKSSGHGTLSLREGLAQSCDVFFYELVRRGGLTQHDLYHYARLFGLGEKTKIDLPEEIEGFVPSEEWKERKYRGERWWTGDSLNMVIGQGWITVTPLQMARVCAAVANGGDLLRPHIVQQIEWPPHLGFAGPTIIGRTVERHLGVRPETLQIVREAMRLAVTHGTGAALRDFPIAVAGKTGSAQHLPGRPTHAWFVCFAPYEKPKYAVAVIVTEGGHGGQTAAPIARQILAALFRIKGGAAGVSGPSD